MTCPFCNHEKTDCIDSRPATDQVGPTRRRSYKCRSCAKRFSTKEYVAERNGAFLTVNLNTEEEMRTMRGELDNVILQVSRLSTQVSAIAAKK